MQFKARVSTVSQMEYAEPQLRESFDITCESYEDAEEVAIMHLEMLAKHSNGALWDDDRIIITIMPAN